MQSSMTWVDLFLRRTCKRWFIPHFHCILDHCVSGYRYRRGSCHAWRDNWLQRHARLSSFHVARIPKVFQIRLWISAQFSSRRSTDCQSPGGSSNHPITNWKRPLHHRISQSDIVWQWRHTPRQLWLVQSLDDVIPLCVFLFYCIPLWGLFLSLSLFTYCSFDRNLFPSLFNLHIYLYTYMCLAWIFEKEEK